jgi:hypothetical protein
LKSPPITVPSSDKETEEIKETEENKEKTDENV